MTSSDDFHASVRTGPSFAGLSRRRLLAGSSALLAAGVGAAGLTPHPALARQATPEAFDAADMAAFVVQFVHLEKAAASYGIILPEDQLAALYGLDAATYRDLRDGFDANARQAAEELLADADFAARVDRLPFAPGDSVVGFGDSITDDLQSWAEILRHLLSIQRPDDGIQIVNQGISGDTTTQALNRTIPIVLTQPAWIICLLGTNDATRYGLEATKTVVSLDETVKNLAELRRLATTESAANWAWITPPAVDEALMAASPWSAAFEMSISNEDVIPIADFVRAQPEPVVDLFALLGNPPTTEFMSADGIHPSLAGQQEITRALVEHLTS